MIENPRILGGVRLSRDGDESTSAERQRAAVEHYSSGPGVMGRIVGWAEDLDVSGGLHPMRRPSLGPWLTERADEFDVLAFHKLDRLTRRSRHFAEVIDWCKENGKILVLVAENIDMSTAMGKMFGQIIAAFAEGELDTIAARNQAAALTRRDKGSWIAGAEPIGYRIDKRANGLKGLVQDPWGAKILREICDKVKDDWTPYRIAIDFNRQGVPTWRDHLRTKKGNAVKGTKWRAAVIIEMLTNPTVAGLYTYKGELVEDDEGNPRMITDDPILTHEEWLMLVTRFAPSNKPTATPSRSMNGGVAECGICGGNLTFTGRKHVRADGEHKYRYYLCDDSRQGLCPEPTRVSADLLDSVVNDSILSALGNTPVIERAGKNTSSIKASLAAFTTRLHRLEGDYMDGKYGEEGQEESYWRMHKALTAKVASLRKEIETLDTAPQYVSTGKTWGEVWIEKDDDQKRIFLQRHGVRPIVFRNIADWADEAIVVDLSSLASVAAETGMNLFGQTSLRVGYQVPLVTATGLPMTLEELKAESLSRTEFAKNARTPEEKAVVQHRARLANERARLRRFNRAEMATV